MVIALPWGWTPGSRQATRRRLRVPDVHCHLEALRDPERALAEAGEQGVGPVLAVGMERESNRRTLALRDRFPEIVRAGIGLHPSEVPRRSDAEVEAELDFVTSHLAAADVLGEVGLDYKDAPDASQRRRQRLALERQLHEAAAHSRPVSLHCRRAERDILEIATEFVSRTALGVNLHWFTHSKKLARRCGEAGLYISVGPSILESADQAAVAAVIDADFLLLETDSPVEFGGRPARPAWAIEVARRLAELRREDFEELAVRLQRNSKRYLGGA